MNGEHKRTTLKIRIKSKATNAILAKLIEDNGGSKATAKLLGITCGTLSAWLNFRSVPSLKSQMSFQRRREIFLKLEQLTGRSVTEIFPLSKQDLAPLAKIRQKDVEVDICRLQDLRERPLALVDHRQPVTEAMRIEDLELIDLLISKLPSERLRTVMQCRRLGMSLAETAKVITKSIERVRQHEIKSIEKMKLYCIKHGITANFPFE